MYYLFYDLIIYSLIILPIEGELEGVFGLCFLPLREGWGGYFTLL